ncbi:MAG: exodeoxyribonuclease VII small subunit [Spirochaetales bacterium]|jgi:exodeoxyribonuclease VII small subunit|nr:exodeoxyribonuclease VII small subunit [Spirochaetales bacterium]
MPQSKKSGHESRGGNFEEKLKRLEALASSMKDADLPLEEAMKKFEEGVKLARALEKDLSKIERRIEILVNSPETEDEKPALELFPELNDEE